MIDHPSVHFYFQFRMVAGHYNLPDIVIISIQFLHPDYFFLLLANEILDAPVFFALQLIHCVQASQMTVYVAPELNDGDMFHCSELLILICYNTYRVRLILARTP